MRRPSRALSGEGLEGEIRTPAPVDQFRVATFNVGGGKGRDGRRDLFRTARAIGDDFDLVALQEVSPRHVEALGRALGMGHLYAPAERRWLRQHRGNGLLARLPVGRWTVEPLVGTEGKGYRSLLVAEVPALALTCLVTHLSKHADHDAQLAIVLAALEASQPAVLLGDLNARHDELGLPAPDDPTRIDWILPAGLELEDVETIPTDASDHDIVAARVRLPVSGGTGSSG